MTEHDAEHKFLIANLKFGSGSFLEDFVQVLLQFLFSEKFLLGMVVNLSLHF